MIDKLNKIGLNIQENKNRPYVLIELTGVFDDGVEASAETRFYLDDDNDMKNLQMVVRILRYKYYCAASYISREDISFECPGPLDSNRYESEPCMMNPDYQCPYYVGPDDDDKFEDISKIEELLKYLNEPRMIYYDRYTNPYISQFAFVDSNNTQFDLFHNFYDWDLNI